MNNIQKVLKNQHICEQATPNLGITQSSGLEPQSVIVVWVSFANNRLLDNLTGTMINADYFIHSCASFTSLSLH